MHISITGDLGSGKSTVGKMLNSHFGYSFLSTGQLQRELAQKHGMDTLEFNKYSDKNIEVDHYIDDHLKKINTSNVPHVLDSRLAWFFVPTSFKVYLLCFDEIAAKRILNDKTRKGEPNAKSIKDKISDSNLRRSIENKRFEKVYGAKFRLSKNFDLVLDTSFISTEEVFNLIVIAYNNWKSGGNYNKFLLSPKRIYPLEPAGIVSSEREKYTSESTSDSYPVSLIESKSVFYMYDGHKKLSASFHSSSPLIPCNVVASGEDEVISGVSVEKYIQGKFSLNQCHEWEDAHSFKYYSYPTL
jgi:predicted cytidylate kinase